MERQTVCKVFGGVHRTQAHAAGKGGKEKRTVHDGKDTDGSRRSRLLQDTAFQSYSQIIKRTKEPMYKGYPQARSDTPFLMGESSKTARTGFILIVQSPSLSNNISLSGHHVRLLQ